MSTIVLDKVSRWFGNVVAVNDVTMTIGPGVTGLLGPNGAGKTTLMAMMSGFLPPSSGSVTLDGEPVWRHTAAYRQIGLVPERELSFGYLTGRQFVRANADLHRLPNAASATESILGVVDMVEPASRRIDTYSKGMRQRIKIAAALVHDPTVLLLDEPFNGVDPRQRMHLMDLLRRLGDDGRTVLFSSHILEEVERLAAPHRGGRLRPACRIRRLRGHPPADDRSARPLHDHLQRRPGPRRRTHRTSGRPVGQPPPDRRAGGAGQRPRDVRVRAPDADAQP